MRTGRPIPPLTLTVCGRAYVMDGGRVVLEGTGEELAASAKVKEIYWGALSSSSSLGNGDARVFRAPAVDTPGLEREL